MIDAKKITCHTFLCQLPLLELHKIHRSNPIFLNYTDLHAYNTIEVKKSYFMKQSIDINQKQI